MYMNAILKKNILQRLDEKLKRHWKLIGYVQTEINYNEADERWEIMDTLTKTINAYLNFTSELPTGRQSWYLPNLDTFEVFNLHAYVEQPGHYACTDGSVIKSEAVCDSVVDCLTEEDESEENCQKVIIPPLYKKMEPPSMNITFEILNLLGVNDREFSFDVVFRVEMSWFDIQLDYKYLSMKDRNYISEKEQSLIWLPIFTFDHVQDNFKRDPTKPKIIRSSPQKMSSEFYNVDVVERYLGKDTPLTISISDRSSFFCGFERISNYPFGDQVCYFTFHLEGSARVATNLTGTLIEQFTGPKTIGRYNAENWKINHEIDMLQRQSLKISVTLSRSKISILMVRFLPSFVINIINLVTIYINVESKYEVIITVNITSLMVLAQIYMTISTDLPSTPTIKPVEFWLLFNFFVPSVIILEAIMLQVLKIIILICLVFYSK